MKLWLLLLAIPLSARTELGMAETTFSVPKFPARTWILTTGKAADGSWFTSLKSQ